MLGPKFDRWIDGLFYKQNPVRKVRVQLEEARIELLSNAYNKEHFEAMENLCRVRIVRLEKQLAEFNPTRVDK